MPEYVRSHPYLLLQGDGAVDLGETPSWPAGRSFSGRTLSSHCLGNHVVVHPHLQDAPDDVYAIWVFRGDKCCMSGARTDFIEGIE